MILICPAKYSGGSTVRLALRDWPSHKWLELCRQLKRHSEQFKVVLGPTDDPSLLDEFSGRTIKPRKLIDLVDVLSSAELIVTQDSGYMHIGRAKGIPVIALFGPTAPAIFSGRNGVLPIVSEGSLACRPCHDGRAFTADCDNNLCMSSISVEVVLKQIAISLRRDWMQ